MRGRNPETGEFHSSSRSQQRREALAILDLAEKLTSIPAAQLEKISMPDDLRELTMQSRKIHSHIARKRQVQFLAKAIRNEDDDVIEALRTALEHDKAEARRETAELHRIESWRERLLDGDDEALTQLIGEHPHADRQHLRHLIRNAKQEKLANRPPHAYRELFRELKTLLSEEMPLKANDSFDEEETGNDDSIISSRQ